MDSWCRRAIQDAIAAAVEQVIADPQRRQIISDRAVETVKSHFSLEATGRVFLERYSQMLEGR